jgi:hypothetical protein
MNFLAKWPLRRPPAFERTVAADTLGRAFSEHGVVLIREALTANQAAGLRDVVGLVYDALEAAVAQDAAMEDDLRDNFVRWQGVWLAGLPQVLAERSPALNAEFAAAAATIHDFVTRRFPENSWRPYDSRSFLRRRSEKTPRMIASPWHMDADTAGTATGAHRCINVWLPLQDVGTTTPSLEFVLGSHVHMKTKEFGTTGYYRTDDWVNAIPGRKWAPVMGLGDAVVFDQYALHRTQVLPSDLFARTSCEFRFLGS